MQTTVQFQKLPILALACLLTACSSDASGPANQEPSGYERRFNISVTLRYLEVTSGEACDGRAVFTNDPRDGEFQYGAEVESGGRVLGSLESPGYGSVLGESFSALPGELINFTNRTVVIDSLKPGDEVAINFFATEWDVTAKDSDMDDLHSSTVLVVTDSLALGTFPDRIVRLPWGGSSHCELTLVWDRTVSSIMVPVP